MTTTLMFLAGLVTGFMLYAVLIVLVVRWIKDRERRLGVGAVETETACRSDRGPLRFGEGAYGVQSLIRRQHRSVSFAELQAHVNEWPRPLDIQVVRTCEPHRVLYIDPTMRRGVMPAVVASYAVRDNDCLDLEADQVRCMFDWRIHIERDQRDDAR